MFHRFPTLFVIPLLLAALTAGALTWWLWPRPIAVVELPAGDCTEVTLNPAKIDRFRQSHLTYCLICTKGNSGDAYHPQEWCNIDLKNGKIQSTFTTESSLGHVFWTPEGKMLYLTVHSDKGNKLGSEVSKKIKSWLYDPDTNQHILLAQRRVINWNRELIATDYSVMLDVSHPNGDPMRCEVIDPKTLLTKRTMVFQDHVSVEDSFEQYKPSCALSQDGKTFAIAETWYREKRTSPQGIDLYDVETGRRRVRLTEMLESDPTKSDLTRYSRDMGAFHLHFVNNHFLMATLSQRERVDASWGHFNPSNLMGYDLKSRNYQKSPCVPTPFFLENVSLHGPHPVVSTYQNDRIVWIDYNATSVGQGVYVTNDRGDPLSRKIKLPEHVVESGAIYFSVTISESTTGIVHTHRLVNSDPTGMKVPMWASQLPKSWQEFLKPPSAKDINFVVWWDYKADELWEFRRVKGTCHVYSRGDRLLLGIHKDGKSWLEIWASPPPRPVNPWLVGAVSSVVWLFSVAWIWRRRSLRSQSNLL
jgi:hypothetical protein